ncbi:MAG TPA: MaoC family dehydratase [Acidimicrobiales bacterium]|jgi:acyl dehydratase|nr:MaoC family dehydratase [Acidimicrobiales bacterium]
MEDPHQAARPAGRWFEELIEGEVVAHAVTRTVTEADNVQFCTMTMNPQPLHLDFDFAARTEFKRPLVNSLLTLALLVGLSVWELTLGTTVANLGFEETEFPVPVFIGDTLHASTLVLEARLSKSRSGVGVVRFEHVAFNQHEVVVARCRRIAMMHCRPLQPGQ